MSAIKTDPEILGGTPCFAGTRVPVAALFDHLAYGYNTDYFLDDFPSVTREQVESVLSDAKRLLAPAPESQPQAARRTAEGVAP